MQAWHEKNNLRNDYPLRIFISENIEYPPHWHEELEIIYVIEGTLRLGVNNEIYTLTQGDIFLIGTGDVHHFISQQEWRKIFIIQAGLSLVDSFASSIRDRKFLYPLLSSSGICEKGKPIETYNQLKAQICLMADEFVKKQEGYRLALKARFYDLLVLIIRQIPMERYSDTEKSRRLAKLERLDSVFKYVEENYYRDISLEDISRVANFSSFHFTRFFKEAAGMTFGQYLSSFRVSKAEVFLTNVEDSITQVAFKSGFNSIKTFNRVFKELKGYSPSRYRKGNF